MNNSKLTAHGYPCVNNIFHVYTKGIKTRKVQVNISKSLLPSPERCWRYISTSVCLCLLLLLQTDAAISSLLFFSKKVTVLAARPSLSICPCQFSPPELVSVFLTIFLLCGFCSCGHVHNNRKPRISQSPFLNVIFIHSSLRLHLKMLQLWRHESGYSGVKVRFSRWGKPPTDCFSCGQT